MTPDDVIARSQVSVVVATRDRRAELARTLGRLTALRPRPPLIIVDNASSDGTAAFVRRTFPEATVVTLPENRGAAARNVGVALADTPYVAFSDDDSWWEPGALDRAAAALTARPRLGLVAAAVLVGDAERPDPINERLAGGLPDDPGPGRRVLGFLACAAVVRTSAFRQVGGFSDLLFFCGEEALLAQDLTAAGWECRHMPEVRAHHHPSRHRPTGGWRSRLERRNAVLSAWLRRPLPRAAAETAGLARDSVTDRDARLALGGALRRLPSAVRHRRPLPRAVERDLRVLEAR
ncbi:glycosyltransferase family 2 protein [Marinactinospora rubrisoli]|uniref:Glycosyltransferase family 2 protein n=1 Tax=Marinactinospora rubrisoli TaxID=2715399 RepID=A0ABW2KQ66_9ACTN